MSKNRLQLASIEEAILKIIEYSKEFSNAEDFYHDAKSFDASMMQFVVIAEMIEKLSDDFKLSHDEVEWQKIKDFRN
ncbi:MAG: HepT-like ribonuclease domain-containing protein, partial [Campylobacterota bacterium]|nr:HepT-like ribonuclease domain-containing protein [Campylobacterota bacterium]